MANTYLTRTQGTGNRQIFTQSFWCKIADTSGTQALAGAFDDASNYSYCYLDGGNLKLQWKASGSVIATLDTNRKFRDTNAFYNIIYAVDTTQSTSADRIKLYVNGVQETSFSTATYPSQNASAEINGNGITYNIGSASSGQNFNGIMSYVAHIDGTQELPTIFGETDATTGEWKIKTTITPSVGWGTNGFLILKDGNTITDQSSNSNDFTLGGGTLTNTEDSPSNVFATLNSLLQSGVGTLTNGNLSHASSSGMKHIASTLGMTTGKFYAEVKYTGGGNYNGVGFVSEPIFATTTAWYSTPYSGLLTYTDVYNNGTAYGTYAVPSTNDIIGIALDIDNGYAYFSNNGVWGNSGNPESGATGTGGFLISRTGANLTYFFASEQDATPGTRGADWNFGNGTFGTTAVASAGTNASGNGIFEYDVPTGYTALSTKGLNL